MKHLNKLGILLISLTMPLCSCKAGSDKYYTVTFEYPGYYFQKVKEGEKASKPSNDPVKEPSLQFTYTFDAWYKGENEFDFNTKIYEDIVLKPKFISNAITYNIKFVNDDVVLQDTDYYYGVTPKYLGPTPTKEDTEDFSYEFKGWDHPITSVTKDDVYVATFTPRAKTIQFVDLEPIYYPYHDLVKSYLEASEPNVNSYANQISEASKPIEIKWDHSFEGVISQTFEYGLKDDFSDAEVVDVSLNKRSVSLYNLLKDSEYYIRVTVSTDNDTYTTSSSFRTANLGPRTMKIDGVCNVRDLGGYMTESGKVTKQGLAYRGGALLLSTDIYTNQITEKGKNQMSNELGIKAELDLRTQAENKDKNVTESPIPGASLTYFGVIGYEAAFTQKDNYKRVFKALANKAIYPFYMHCTGGADRTGTVSFLYNALLGVSLTDLIHDYEMTTFSVYGERNSRAGTTYNFAEFYEILTNNYQGDTLSKKVENYLLDIGLTSNEITSIKNIAFGEVIPTSISCDNYLMPLMVKAYKITVSDDSEAEKVYFNNSEVSFLQTGNTISVPSSELYDFDGSYDVKVLFKDGQISERKDVNVEKVDFTDIDDLFDFNENGECYITGQTSSKSPIGYDKFARIHLKTECGVNGGIYILIGSYGVYLRGGELRTAHLENGVVKEHQRYLGVDCRNDTFNNGDVTLLFSIHVESDKAYYTIHMLKDDVLTTKSYSSQSFKLTSGEIPSEQAKLTLSLVTGSDNGGSKITLYQDRLFRSNF